jgi:hypothetical protein
MKCRFVFGTLGIFLAIVGTTTPAESAKDQEASKAALQQLHEFIGQWKGEGQTKSGKSEEWKEGMNWGWRFKGGEAWMMVEFENDKTLGKGDLKFIPDKKIFRLTATDAKKNEVVFEGVFKGKQLVLSRVDDETKDKYIITMSTNNDGARFIYKYEYQAKGKGLEKPLFMVTHKKEGASLTGGKKNECVVSGGLGTTPVTYNGKTYYVCCSGCAEAFRENPKKFVDEFEKKKK